MFDFSSDERTIYVYDGIGHGEITADDIHGALKDLGEGKITMRLASPGGDVWEALRAYNAIREHGQVEIIVDAIAASAASYIAMAGSKISMAENALMMIHAPWTMAYGNAREFRRTAEDLDKHAQAMAAAYSKKSGKPVEDIHDIFDKEVWYGANEAVAAGFADEVIEDYGVTAKMDPTAYKYEHIPESIAARMDRPFSVKRPQDAEPGTPRLDRLKGLLAKLDEKNQAGD